RGTTIASRPRSAPTAGWSPSQSTTAASSTARSFGHAVLPDGGATYSAGTACGDSASTPSNTTTRAERASPTSQRAGVTRSTRAAGSAAATVASVAARALPSVTTATSSGGPASIQPTARSSSA